MTIRIGSFEIGAGRAFVIAEIGNNHNGSFERAIEMIDTPPIMVSGTSPLGLISSAWRIPN